MKKTKQIFLFSPAKQCILSGLEEMIETQKELLCGRQAKRQYLLIISTQVSQMIAEDMKIVLNCIARVSGLVNLMMILVKRRWTLFVKNPNTYFSKVYMDYEGRQLVKIVLIYGIT